VPFALTLILVLVAPLAARAQGAGADSVQLAWTAPGDDGSVGTASLYDLRMSQAPISDANWSAATAIAGMPAPLVAGTQQKFTVHGLTNGTTYYFAIKTRDDAGNWSGLSNVARWDWVLDTSPPAAPGGLAASPTGHTVKLTWTANSEPDLSGYSVYRAAAVSGPWTRLNDSLLVSSQYIDGTLAVDVTDAWYEVTASDASGNESARSAELHVSFGGSSAVSTAFSLSPVYPNPSPGNSSVHLPIVVPGTGAHGVLLDVLDSGGHRVRRLDLGDLPPGNQTATWDGRNDAGRPVAPGVYTALLIAGDVRQRTRLVRLP
jgi:hypothetical protein